jgi:hypothetical protein
MSHSNEVTYLQMLVDESNKIIEDKKPNKDWFRERILKIFEYLGLVWKASYFKHDLRPSKVYHLFCISFETDLNSFNSLVGKY